MYILYIYIYIYIQTYIYVYHLRPLQPPGPFFGGCFPLLSKAPPAPPPVAVRWVGIPSVAVSPMKLVNHRIEGEAPDPS